MRWGLQSDALLSRFTGSLVEQLRELVPVVVPVAIVGQDRDDVSRPVWAHASSIAAAAGQFPTFSLAAPNSPFELLGAWFNGTSGQLVSGMCVPVTQSLGGVLPPSVFVQNWSPAGRSPSARVSAGSIAGGGFPTVLQVELTAVDTPWPVAPVVVAAGFQVGFQGQTAASTLRAAFFWRDLS